MQIKYRCTTSQRALRVAGACVLGLSGMASADEVKLLNGGKLTGKVLSMHESGAIHMNSALAADPLSLNGDAVKQIEFARAETIQTSGNTRFELPNKDFLIGTLLGYSRDTGARIHADGIGEIELPVAGLSFMSLDMQPVHVIYNGPDEIANWTTGGHRAGQNWQYTRNRLSATGSGQIGRMLDLPDRFVIRLNLSWQGQPNFQLGFSDPLEEPQVRVDRYYLQFGRAGLEIKRETKEGKRYHTVGMLNRTPDQFPNREMDIELRVDRRESVIHLAINGKQEGRFMDPFGGPPAANGISLVSNASPGHQLEIRSLTVESWHENAAKLPTQQPKAAGARDSLMMREGDNFSGILESIVATDDGLQFMMKVDFRDQPITILGADVAMVGFAAGQAEDLNSQLVPTPGFVLKLKDRGHLTVTQSLFEDGRVRAVHPLLGDLTISRNVVSSLERQMAVNKPDAE